MNASTRIKSRWPRTVSAAASSRRLACIAAGLTLTMVTFGCAAPKDQYAGAAEAQQRMAAEDAASSKASASIDTQATYLRLVEQMQREGLWFASLAHIDALEQRWGVSPEINRARADALRNTGQLAQSEEFYRRLIGTPMESSAYHGLGLLAGARANYVEAAELLKKAQLRSPTDAMLLNDLGYANLRAGRIADARLPLMQATQLQPDNPQAQSNLALYLEASQQSEQAAALMEARRMPVATRAAIREAARQLVGTGSLPTGAAPLLPSATTNNYNSSDAGAAPLALKPSRRSGNLRAPPATTLPDESAASVSVVATPLSSTPLLRGTP
ncbi:hypothetical protein ACSFA7_31395 [Variovorax sp. LT1R20]|uniref:hypothetical protein n=1 Tax=Variovorax sp. LT1R20 TaxID=3443729 RepID=UPI003F4719EA